MFWLKKICYLYSCDAVKKLAARHILKYTQPSHRKSYITKRYYKNKKFTCILDHQHQEIITLRLPFSRKHWNTGIWFVVIAKTGGRQSIASRCMFMYVSEARVNSLLNIVMTYLPTIEQISGFRFTVNIIIIGAMCKIVDF